MFSELQPPVSLAAIAIFQLKIADDFVSVNRNVPYVIDNSCIFSSVSLERKYVFGVFIAENVSSG